MWRPVLVADRALRSAEDCGPSASSLSPAGCSVICATMTILTCAQYDIALTWRLGIELRSRIFQCLVTAALVQSNILNACPLLLLVARRDTGTLLSLADHMQRAYSVDALTWPSTNFLRNRFAGQHNAPLAAPYRQPSSFHRATTMPTAWCRGVRSKAVGYQSSTSFSNIGVVTFSEQRRHMAAQQSVGAVKKWTPRIGA